MEISVLAWEEGVLTPVEPRLFTSPWRALLRLQHLQVLFADSHELLSSSMIATSLL